MRLLANAVTGVPIGIVWLPKTASSYTDGERIYLASRALRESRQELIVQAALIAAGSLGREQMRGLLGRAEVAERYLLLEVLRSCALLQDRLPRRFIDKLRPYRTKYAPSTPEESLRLASTRKPLPQPPSWFGTLRPWRILRATPEVENAPFAQKQLQRLESKLKKIEASDEEPNEDKATKTSIWKWFTSPLGKDTLLSKLVREALDMKSSPDRTSDSGGSVSSDMVSGRVSRRITDIRNALRSSMMLVLSPTVAENSSAHHYPEWDCNVGRYRDNWTSVEEVAPANLESQVSEHLFSFGSDRAFQRPLAKIRLGLMRQRRLAQGDDLVLDQVIRLAVDLKTGHSGDERVYSANMKSCRDLGIQILLDVSSSTLERNADGTRIFELQAQAAYRLCRAFASLGTRVAMHGFHSWGRGLVRLQILKDFDEAAGHLLAARMSRILVAGYTRCGAAVRHSTHCLETRSDTPYKLLLLISDGFPYDEEYEQEYASSDTRMAIEEARAKGIAVACLSLGSDADAQRLKLVYGAVNYLALAKAEQLPPRLSPLIQAAFAAALRPGRTHLRT